MVEKTHRLIVGISGASGVILGIRILEALKSTEIETHLVITPAAQEAIVRETEWEVHGGNGSCGCCIRAYGTKRSNFLGFFYDHGYGGHPLFNQNSIGHRQLLQLQLTGACSGRYLERTSPSCPGRAGDSSSLWSSTPDEPGNQSRCNDLSTGAGFLHATTQCAGYSSIIWSVEFSTLGDRE